MSDPSKANDEERMRIVDAVLAGLESAECVDLEAIITLWIASAVLCARAVTAGRVRASGLVWAAEEAQRLIKAALTGEIATTPPPSTQPPTEHSN